MKLGLGFRSNYFNDENLAFAKQLGVTHIILFMPDETIMPSARDGYWSYEDLLGAKKHIESFGLKLEGIENFLAGSVYKILLDRPGKEEQMEKVKASIRNMGRAGIGVMGYNFSIAGVWGRVDGPYARGGAISPKYGKDVSPPDSPVPNGYVWNRKIEENPAPGNIGPVSREEMWRRLTYFLENIIPVAEKSGVRMAAHPEDPPLPVMRNTARLLVNTESYDRLFSIMPSSANAIEFCQGTFSEMPGIDVYEAIRKFGSAGKIGYVHFRNVNGKLPEYTEAFIDDGDTDMLMALKAYKECGYEGVLIPDHSPEFKCPGHWHTGNAYAIGYIKALMKVLGIKI